MKKIGVRLVAVLVAVGMMVMGSMTFAQVSAPADNMTITNNMADQIAVGEGAVTITIIARDTPTDAVGTHALTYTNNTTNGDKRITIKVANLPANVTLLATAVAGTTTDLNAGTFGGGVLVTDQEENLITAITSNLVGLQAVVSFTATASAQFETAADVLVTYTITDTF